MAELVVAAAGSFVGNALLGSAPVFLGLSGGALGWAVGGALGSTFGPKQKAMGPRLEDLKVSGAGYGQPVPWVAGSPRVSGTIIWSSKKRETATTIGGGGKGGGGSEYTEYTYDCDILYMVSENEINSCDKIFSNGKLVFNGGIKDGFCDEVIVYSGADDQLPDPTYEAAVGVGNAPAYRGRGTILIKGLKLGNSGFLPNLTFSINSKVAFEPDSDVLFMLRFDQDIGETSFVDSSIYNVTVNNHNPLNLSVSGGGAYLNCASQNATGLGVDAGFSVSANTAFPLAKDDKFTLRFRWRPRSVGGVIYSSSFSRLLWTGGNSFTYAIRSGNSGGTGTMSPASVPVDLIKLNQWYSFYICSNGTKVIVKIDGHLVYEADPPNEGFSGGFQFGGANDSFLNTPADADWDEIQLALGIRDEDEPLPLAIDNVISPVDPLYGTNSLSETVDDLMARAGYASDEYDISGLIASNEPRIRAMYLSQVAPTRSAIEILQSAYYFTVSKSDKIYFRFRDIYTSGIFNYADMGVSDSPEASDNPFQIKNTSVLEQPSQISLTYNNMSFDFNQDVASSDILVTDQKSTNAIQIPLGLLPSEAKGIVESMLLDQVAARVQYGPFRLPLSYAKYEPSDVVLIPDTEGDLHRVRLVKKTDMGVMLEFEGVGDDEGALIESGIADDSNQGQVDVEIASGSLWLPGDWPLFRDADDAPGYLALAKSKGDGDFWPGAGFFRSWDGVTFSQVGSFSASSIFGKCSTVLSDFNGGNVWDESSVLRVDVGQGELSSSTKTAMQSDLSINVAMVGSECIRFRLATLISPGVYDLSGLIRGFRGTEWAIGIHGADEDFALVNFNTNWINLNTNQIGLNQFVKAVTFNNPLSSEDATQFNYTGVNLKPFSVSNPRALYTEDGLLISWNRRTRRSYSYGGVAGVVAPLGEAFERYRLYFYDGSTLMRTEVVNDAQEFLYTEEMANEDGLSSNASVTIEIVQVSEIVGDGYPSYVEGMMQ